MSVGRQVREALGAKGRTNRTYEASEVGRLLAEVCLQDLDRVARLRSDQLSGGMAQGVMMAIAIAAGPSILLVDVPTSSLDSILKAQTLELIHTEQRARGLGVLLMTHDLGSVSQMADRVVEVDAGRVILQTPFTSFDRNQPCGKAYGPHCTRGRGRFRCRGGCRRQRCRLEPATAGTDAI